MENWASVQDDIDPQAKMAVEWHKKSKAITLSSFGSRACLRVRQPNTCSNFMATTSVHCYQNLNNTGIRHHISQVVCGRGRRLTRSGCEGQSPTTQTGDEGQMIRRVWVWWEGERLYMHSRVRVCRQGLECGGPHNHPRYFDSTIYSARRHVRAIHLST